MNGQITLTLNSLFNQQYKDYQVVIADAASSDNTLAIVAEYLKNN
jgi:glycosyltransferase involved in cell wall biosynthesis